MTPQIDPGTLRLALPKGRMHDAVMRLFADAGIAVNAGPRAYRPVVSLPAVDCKVLKPHNVISMLEAGARDLGLAGADWAAELNADSIVEILDTGLDPVRLVAAAPASLLEDGRLPDRPLIVASEYERLTREWIRRRELDARVIRSWGATEVFPPEDADCIVDNSASGSTLAANGLVVIDEVMRSSTRLFASRSAMDDPERLRRIETIAMLLRSVLEARRRVMIDLNVSPDRLASVIDVLPCMREPTVSPLHAGAGYAVRAAVPRDRLSQVIPLIKACGGTDLVVSEPSQIVP